MFFLVLKIKNVLKKLSSMIITKGNAKDLKIQIYCDLHIINVSHN